MGSSRWDSAQWFALLFILLLGLALPAPAADGDAAARLDIANTLNADPTLAALPRVLYGQHYTHNLSSPQLRRGVAYTGANLRLRRVVQKLQRGDPVHVGVIGGACTAHAAAALRAHRMPRRWGAKASRHEGEGGGGGCGWR
jgi:hypothetical protein